MGAQNSLQDHIPKALQNQGVEAMAGRNHSDKSPVRGSSRSWQFTLNSSTVVIWLKRSINLLSNSPYRVTWVNLNLISSVVRRRSSYSNPWRK